MNDHVRYVLHGPSNRPREVIEDEAVKVLTAIQSQSNFANMAIGVSPKITDEKGLRLSINLALTEGGTVEKVGLSQFYKITIEPIYDIFTEIDYKRETN